MKTHEDAITTDLIAMWATVGALRQLTDNRSKGTFLIDKLGARLELVKYFRLAFDKQKQPPPQLLDFDCRARPELAEVVLDITSKAWPDWGISIALLNKVFAKLERPPIEYPKDEAAPLPTYKGKPIGTVLVRIEFVSTTEAEAPYSRAVLLDGDMRVADIIWIKGAGMRRVLTALESVGVLVQ